MGSVSCDGQESVPLVIVMAMGGLHFFMGFYEPGLGDCGLQGVQGSRAGWQGLRGR